jgi:hypothetical protein
MWERVPPRDYIVPERKVQSSIDLQVRVRVATHRRGRLCYQSHPKFRHSGDFPFRH